MTAIDPWFLTQVQEVVLLEKTLEAMPYYLNDEHFFFADVRGFITNNSRFGGNAGLGAGSRGNFGFTAVQSRHGKRQHRLRYQRHCRQCRRCWKWWNFCRESGECRQQ